MLDRLRALIGGSGHLAAVVVGEISCIPNGKKTEVPVRRVLMGMPAGRLPPRRHGGPVLVGGLRQAIAAGSGAAG